MEPTWNCKPQKDKQGARGFWRPYGPVSQLMRTTLFISLIKQINDLQNTGSETIQRMKDTRMYTIYIAVAQSLPSLGSISQQVGLTLWSQGRQIVFGPKEADTWLYSCWDVTYHVASEPKCWEAFKVWSGIGRLSVTDTVRSSILLFRSSPATLQKLTNDPIDQYVKSIAEMPLLDCARYGCPRLN
jgi:hypothetical protein